jgi:uncharacterized protein
MSLRTTMKIGAIAALPLVLGAAVAGDTGSPYTNLSVQGIGYGTQDTEFLTVNASHTGFSTSAGTAIRENARVLDGLRSAIKRYGIADADFRTSSFQFSRTSDPDDRSSNPARGYAVTQSLAIIVRDVPKAGDIIERLVDAGAKDVNVYRGYGYSRAPTGSDLSAVRLAAIRDAQAKAQDYAHALGLKIRRVITVNDGSSYSMDGPPPPAAMRSDVAATQIDAPKSTLVYSVGVQFELER